MHHFAYFICTEFLFYLSAISPLEFGVVLAMAALNGFLSSPYFDLTPRFSRNSQISTEPCISRFTPLGKPRHDDKLIEFKYRQWIKISLTASTETDDPHKFKWLQIQ